MAAGGEAAVFLGLRGASGHLLQGRCGASGPGPREAEQAAGDMSEARTTRVACPSSSRTPFSKHAQTFRPTQNLLTPKV